MHYLSSEKTAEMRPLPHLIVFLLWLFFWEKDTPKPNQASNQTQMHAIWVSVPLVKAVNDILADVAMCECFLNGNWSFLANQIQKEKSPSLLAAV